jgi:outer membrane protein OmpA-like peptidoglycan-associated protein
VNALLKAGTSSLVPGLFGDKGGAIVNALSSYSGIKSSSATSLLALVVPLVLTFLKKFIGDKGLNANSLASLLSGQGPNLQGMLDSRMSSALGFASPSAFLSGLGGQAADMARGAGAAVAGGAAAATTATKSGFMRWLPWIIGAAVLLFLWNLLSGKSTPPPAAAPTAAVTAPAAMPAPAPAAAAVSLPAKVYFEVGSAAIGADGSKTIGAAADMIKKDGLKVAVTGYTDKTGDVAKNEELAKSRAAAVRDALKAAGVAETSVEMKPPMFVEIGAGGSDAEARRVEINKQ